MHAAISIGLCQQTIPFAFNPARSPLTFFLVHIRVHPDSIARRLTSVTPALFRGE